MNPDLFQTDSSLILLKRPDEHTDDEIFDALRTLSCYPIAASPVITVDTATGKHFLCEIWKCAMTSRQDNHKTVFEECFGNMSQSVWHPLSNAVYLDRSAMEPFEYALSPCRKYTRSDGVWTEHSYRRIFFHKKKLDGFLRESDRRLRVYLKTGHALKERPAEAWAAPYIEAVIEADRQEKIRAAKPIVRIDFSGLEQIRMDALKTRDSLLTENETEDCPEHSVPPQAHADRSMETDDFMLGTMGSTDSSEAPQRFAIFSDEWPLDEIHTRILKLLASGEAVDTLMLEHHLMFSIVADTINDTLFDEFGDNILECDGSCLSLVEDYRDDVIALLKRNGLS